MSRVSLYPVPGAYEDAYDSDCCVTFSRSVQRGASPTSRKRDAEDALSIPSRTNSAEIDYSRKRYVAVDKGHRKRRRSSDEISYLNSRSSDSSLDSDDNDDDQSDIEYDQYPMPGSFDTTSTIIQPPEPTEADLSKPPTKEPRDWALLSRFLESTVSDAAKFRLNHVVASAKKKGLKESPGYIYVFMETPIVKNRPVKLSRSKGKIEAAFDRQQLSNHGLSVQPTSATTKSRLEIFTDAFMSLTSAVRDHGPTNAMSLRAGSGKMLVKIGKSKNAKKRVKDQATQCKMKVIPLLCYHSDITDIEPRMEESVVATTTGAVIYSTAGRNPSHDPVHFANKIFDSQRSEEIQAIRFSLQTEKLVHAMLWDYQVKWTCAHDGVEHTEWFEIPATLEGLMMLDDTIRRCINFSKGFWKSHLPE